MKATGCRIPGTVGPRGSLGSNRAGFPSSVIKGGSSVQVHIDMDACTAEDDEEFKDLTGHTAEGGEEFKDLAGYDTVEDSEEFKDLAGHRYGGDDGVE